MKLEIRLRSIFAVGVLLLLLESSAYGRMLSNTKPDRRNLAASARWLVSQNTWAVLSVLAGPDRGGVPFGHVVSFSDGLPDKGTGVPYFFLTKLDTAVQYALKDNRVSLAMSEYPLGTCTKDTMDPTCARVTLSGKLLPVEEGSQEAEVAEKALFAKHPEMSGWPKGHNFLFFKLEINDIFLLNWYGGAKPITVEEYFNVKSVGLFL